ncbi:MAG: hypothetical protein J0M34_09485 [Alphaproteobacteria bacterium]|nr:hypothetical protein [Alphaproteobacteria bacterium]
MAAARPPQQPAPTQPRPKPAGKGFHLDFMMPFRATGNFIAGTIGGTLDGMSQWGNRGFKFGLASGVVMGIFGAPPLLASMSFVGLVIGCTLAATVGGMALGAAAGALTGGFTRAERMERREAARARMRTATAGPQAVSTGDAIDRINDSNFDRQLQQNAENATYWRDQVSGPSSGMGRGH